MSSSKVGTSASAGSTDGGTIQARLKAEAGTASMQTLFALMSLQAEQAPSDLSVEPHGAPKIFCFDATGALEAAAPTYTAHALCSRCRLVNQLVQGLSRNPTSTLAKSLIRSSLITTSCESELQSKQTGAAQVELPMELVYMVVDCAITDLESTGDGSLVAALMHTSNQLRYRAVKAFEPVQVYECLPESNPTEGNLHFHTSAWLYARLWGVLQDFFQDFSTKPPSKARVLAALLAQKGGKEIVTSTEGLTGTAVVCSIYLCLDEVSYNGKIFRDAMELSAEHPDTVDSLPIVQAARLVETVQCGLESLVRDGFYEDEDPPVCFMAPCFANAHQRALNGSLLAPTVGARITLQIDIHPALNDPVHFDRTFCFDTLKVRKSGA